MNILKRKMHTFLFLITGLSMLVAPVVVTASAGALALPSGFADSVDDARNGIDLAKDGSGSGASSISKVVTTLINILSAIVGVAAVVMIIVGGLKYVTSNGDANNVSGAKSTIIYAMVGLVVVAMAQVIVHFVIRAAKV